MELNTLSKMEQQIIMSMNTMFELDCDCAHEMRDCGWVGAYILRNIDPKHLVMLGLAELHPYREVDGFRYRLTLAGFAVAAELQRRQEAK